MKDFIRFLVEAAVVIAIGAGYAVCLHELTKGSPLHELLMRGYHREDLVGMVAFALFAVVPLWIITTRIGGWSDRQSRRRANAKRSQR